MGDVATLGTLRVDSPAGVGLVLEKDPRFGDGRVAPWTPTEPTWSGHHPVRVRGRSVSPIAIWLVDRVCEAILSRDVCHVR